MDEAMMCVQMLAELKDIIQVQTKLISERQKKVKQMWLDRFLGGQPLVDDWQRIFYDYSLGVNPDIAVPSWLQFAFLQIPGTCPTAQRVGHKLRVTKQIWKAGQ